MQDDVGGARKERIEEVRGEHCAEEQADDEPLVKKTRLLEETGESSDGSVAEAGCFYDCAGTAGSTDDCFQCDGCDNWFHAQCAGYESDLLENPEYDGHSIQLHAYCGICLEEKELSHADVLDQQEQYLRLERFFDANSKTWVWQPVSQDGRCCLNSIWSKSQGEYPVFENFVSACAKAAMKETDQSADTASVKRSSKALFKRLAQNPGELAQLWPRLEVQYLWMGLATSVLPDVQLRLFELEERQGNVRLRCIQCFPENLQRANTVNLLQWNRKVAAHYDVLEENAIAAAAAAPDVMASFAAVPNGIVVQAPGENAAPEVNAAAAAPDVIASAADPDETAAATTPEECAPVAPYVVDWAVGMLVEAEMMDPSFPNYTDTIHTVEIVEVLLDRNYRCRLTAFDGPNNVDVWTPDLLHAPRAGGSPDVAWMKNDRVHIRIRNRTAGKVKW
jgi:hypothetical protein